MKNQKQQIWALVPAAGVGARMAADRPKQYLTVKGKTILEHTLSVFFDSEQIAGVQLCLSADDAYWSDINLGIDREKLLPVCDGGERRADTVLAGLRALSKKAKPDDWVLVHDAARPCLTQELINKLVTSLVDDAIGGILAVPVADTLKQVSGGDVMKSVNKGASKDINKEIDKTVDRERLWAAQTPQMFRLGMLQECLENALQDDLDITDEASCVEASGFKPKVVLSSRANIKVTYPEDVEWVEHFLER